MRGKMSSCSTTVTTNVPFRLSIGAVAGHHSHSICRCPLPPLYPPLKCMYQNNVGYSMAGFNNTYHYALSFDGISLEDSLL